MEVQHTVVISLSVLVLVLLVFWLMRNMGRSNTVYVERDHPVYVSQPRVPRVSEVNVYKYPSHHHHHSRSMGGMYTLQPASSSDSMGGMNTITPAKTSG